MIQNKLEFEKLNISKTSFAITFDPNDKEFFTNLA